MEILASHKHKTDQLVADVDVLIETAGALCDPVPPEFEHFKKACAAIKQRLNEDILRVAVVGPIKSGKSTLVNALFQGDYLKRGAGVVTAIVTRIRKGKSLKATLWMKGWDQIHQEIHSALALFPSGDFQTESRSLNFRNPEVRDQIRDALAGLDSNRLISQGRRNLESAVLSAYINGYSQIEQYAHADSGCIEFSGEDFANHKTFTGDDNLAVFLNDVQLEIDTDSIDETIEIADCQGSDSPNPLHLIMIQEYLLKAHLLIYVISSRTGIREADFNFLTTIRKMGLMENTLFFVNFDFGEHDTLSNLKNVIGKISEELSLLKPNAELFAASALFNLFGILEKHITEKDRLRLAQWRKEKKMSEFSFTETLRFQDDISAKLGKERYALYLKSHIERLKTVSRSLREWCGVQRGLLSKDSQETDTAMAELQQVQPAQNQIHETLHNALDGAAEQVIKEIRKKVDGFFDKRDGILADVYQALNRYEVDCAGYAEQAASFGLSHAMHSVYQDMKGHLDRFIAEVVTPAVIGFVGETHRSIRSQFEMAIKPFETLLNDERALHRQKLSRLNIPHDPDVPDEPSLPEPARVAEIENIRMPSLADMMYFSPTVQSEALVRLGAYRIWQFIRKFMKKSSDIPFPKEAMAIAHGVSRLKRETEAAIRSSFLDYRENIKFQYLIQLVRVYAAHVSLVFAEYTQHHTTHISQLAARALRTQADRDQTARSLNDIESGCAQTLQHLKELGQSIQEIMGSPTP